MTNRTVAVITTGGTIGAAFGGGVTTLNHDSQLLKQHIETLCKKGGFHLTTFAPLNKFSEDMDPSDWGKTTAAIDVCVKQGIKQIVITHGTDTLAYSAMAASLYYGKSDVKICFTCAFNPPSAPDSDAEGNIDAALHAVCDTKLSPNVYVAFRYNDQEISITRAQDIHPVACDKTLFETLYGDVYADFDPTTKSITLNPTKETRRFNAEGAAPTSEQLSNNACTVIQLPCYPGVSLADLKLDQKKENLIILIAYHSGTMPALALRNEILVLKKSHPRTKVVLSMHPYRHIQAPYETTADLAKEGALIVYKDLLPHQIYTLAVCETSKGKSLDNVLNIIEPWRF